MFEILIVRVYLTLKIKLLKEIESLKGQDRVGEKFKKIVHCFSRYDYLPTCVRIP